MKIIPLPYIRIFTNEEGIIEAQNNLNNAPKEECELLASFLSDFENIDEISNTENISDVITKDEEYERYLKNYTRPVNVEFRLCKNPESGFSCKWPNEVHPKHIILAIKRMAEKALDEAIDGLVT